MKKQLYKNANIITMNNQLLADAMLVDENGEIEFIGTLKDWKKDNQSEVEEIDLNNKTIMPGFVNLNSNIMALSQSLMFCDISLCSSLEKTIKELNKYFNLFKDHHIEFILAVGLDESLFNETILEEIKKNHSELNTKPFILCSKEGNKALINDAMIELFKANDKAQQIKELKNVCDQELFNQIVPFIPAKSLDDAIECTKIAQEMFAKAGITTAQDNLFNLNQLDVLTNLASQDAISIDMVLNLEVNNFKQLFPIIKEKLVGYSHGFRIAGLYIPVDGRLQNQDSFITSQYKENDLIEMKNPNASGSLIAEDKLIANSIKWALNQNTQLVFEANGDAALNFVLKTLREQSPEELNVIRNKKCYVLNCLSSNGDLSAMKLLGLSCLQPVSNLWHFGDLYNQILSDEAVKLLFKCNTAFNENINYTASQDTLLNGLNMFETIWSMSNRKDRSLNVINAAETINTYDALMAVTSNPAHLLFETKKGTLSQGKFADFIILNENPLAIDKGQLSSIKVVATYKKGQAIYKNF